MNHYQDPAIRRSKYLSLFPGLYRLVLFCIGILVAFPGISQQTWKKDFYMPGIYSKSFDAFESYDGGYMIVATIENAATNATHGWIVKSDINGDKLWDKTLGIHSGINLKCIAKTSDGGCIVGGFYYSVQTYPDACIMKLNECAEQEWCLLLPDIESDSYGSTIDVGIVQLEDGSFLCERQRNTLDRYGTESIIKLSPEGSVDWVNYYDSNHDYNYQEDIDLTLTPDGSLLIAGTATDTIYPGYPYVSEFPHFYKVDENGNLLWDTKWYINPFQICGYIYNSYTNSTGGYYGAGSKLKYQLPFVYKISSSGDTVNSYGISTHPKAVGGIVSSMTGLNDTSFVIASGCWRDWENDWLWSLNVTDSLFNNRVSIQEEEQIWDMVLFITQDGKIVQKANGYEDYEPHPYTTILYKFNQNLEYDSIYTSPRIYDSLCSHPILSDTIPMPDYCTVYAALPELPKQLGQTGLHVYPNPANQYITIEIPEFTGNASDQGNSLNLTHYEPVRGILMLLLRNLSGQIVAEFPVNAANRNHVLDVCRYPSGAYQLMLMQQKKLIGSATILITHP